MSPADSVQSVTTKGRANRLVIAVLDGRAGRLLGLRLAVVQYVGRRTGRAHRLVTLYASDGRTVRIRVGMAERKTWWRNFQSPHPMHLTLAGEDYDASARVERTGKQVWVVADLGPPTGT